MECVTPGRADEAADRVDRSRLAGGVGATRRPLAAHRPAAQSTRRLDRRLRLASGLLLRGLIAASRRGRAGQRLQRRREV